MQLGSTDGSQLVSPGQYKDPVPQSKKPGIGMHVWLSLPHVDPGGQQVAMPAAEMQHTSTPVKQSGSTFGSQSAVTGAGQQRGPHVTVPEGQPHVPVVGLQVLSGGQQ